jgi:hypothetical protein
MGDMTSPGMMRLSKLALDWSWLRCIARRSSVPSEVYDYDTIGMTIKHCSQTPDLRRAKHIVNGGYDGEAVLEKRLCIPSLYPQQ